MGKASANGESPRDSYERQRGWDRQIGKRRNGREKWRRDVPPVHYNEETIQLASLRGPWCWLPQTGQQVPSFYWLKARGAEQRETWRDRSDRRLSNFCFISKEKQGQHILGNWAHLCISLLLTCKCKTNQGNSVAVCVFSSYYIGLTWFKCVIKWDENVWLLTPRNVITPRRVIRPAGRETRRSCQRCQQR